jgi:hypothetical protein
VTPARHYATDSAFLTVLSVAPTEVTAMPDRPAQPMATALEEAPEAAAAPVPLDRHLVEPPACLAAKSAVLTTTATLGQRAPATDNVQSLLRVTVDPMTGTITVKLGHQHVASAVCPTARFAAILTTARRATFVPVINNAKEPHLPEVELGASARTYP